MNFSTTANSPAGGSSNGETALSPDSSDKAMRKVLQMAHDRIRRPNTDRDPVPLKGQVMTSRELHHDLEIAREEKAMLDRLFFKARKLCTKTSEKLSQLSRGSTRPKITEEQETGEINVENFEKKYNEAMRIFERLLKEEQEIRAGLREGSPSCVVDEDKRAVRGMGFFSDGEVTDSDVEGRGGKKEGHGDPEEDIEMAVASLEK
ncbi:hypothetical protein FAGAP_8731 [Fusarium agapanthi]|uniref:Uncharacterized protein n=1 Tax=Fusarium agapanthi TaxID=1803897 RepID=A0A9P5B3X7_9HYPO|nr:hypothetical protein FAGAP_8731 [Fusarium agapanthi]